MANHTLTIILLILALDFKITQAESECYLPQAVGSLAGIFLVTETITIFIAVVSCIYLKRKAKKKSELGTSTCIGANIIRDTCQYDNEDGEKTIRVVKNKLYQSMKEPTNSSYLVNEELGSVLHDTTSNKQDLEDSRRSDGSDGKNKDAKPKTRTRTQSSHTYEPITMVTGNDGNPGISPLDNEGTEEKEMYVNITPPQERSAESP